MKLRADRLDERRREALLRNARWAKLSPGQQLEELDISKMRALKQRAKIHKKMEAA